MVWEESSWIEAKILWVEAKMSYGGPISKKTFIINF